MGGQAVFSATVKMKKPRLAMAPSRVPKPPEFRLGEGHNSNVSEQVVRQQSGQLKTGAVPILLFDQIDSAAVATDMPLESRLLL